MNRTTVIIGALWVALISSSLFANLWHTRTAQETVALQSARSFFRLILISRLWNATHGGVYVPVTEDNPPNPYLKDPLREIRVSDDLTLTKINPAYMTRQMSELARQRHQVYFHITSSRPLRPENRPTEREHLALAQFERGAPEVSKRLADGQFFYMAPLKIEKPCLVCHANQGYREGDIHGGISVTLPYVRQHPLPPILGHGVIGLAGLFGILFYGRRLSRAYETLRAQSVVDALTGITNRRGLFERLAIEFERCRRDDEALSVLMCDIDNFKAYNDNYGHKAGDHCLQQVAQAIQDSLSRPQDFCGRYGGEEFVVVLPDTDRQGAAHIAERIRQAVMALQIPHHHGGPLPYVTISLGISSAHARAIESYELLLTSSDEAMYQAKRAGKNRCTVLLPGENASETDASGTGSQGQTPAS
jgi:diguanylate cyclase (GGDEF)-like protein